MKNLNESQFEKVVKLLTYQFNGFTIAFGSRWDFNDKDVEDNGKHE